MALTRGKNLSGSATPRRAALVVAASPVLLYLTFASADVIALGFYAMWLASSRHWLLALGVFTHFALLPYALLHLAATPAMSRVQKLVAGYFLGGTIAIVLLVTPYGGILFIDRGFWSAGAYGLALGLLVALPNCLFFRLGPIHVLAFAVGAAECGLQNHAQARYFLPAILLLAATGQPRFGEVRTPSGGSYRWGLIPRPGPVTVSVAPGQGAAPAGSSSRRLRDIQEGTLR